MELVQEDSQAVAQQAIGGFRKLVDVNKTDVIFTGWTSVVAAIAPLASDAKVMLVSASTAWSDSGVDVRAGQTIFFEAEGRVRWGRDRQDGPAGERNSPSNPNRPMGNRNAAALIGKIGNDLFFIGDDAGPIRMRSSGRLYLGINDDVLTDNSGNFRVVVYY